MSGTSQPDDTYRQRFEINYRVENTPSLLAALRREIAGTVPVYCYRPGKEITGNCTVYMDSDDFSLYRAHQRDPERHLHVRARVYEYDDDGDAERVWLELKERDGTVRRKERFQLSHGDFRRLFEGMTPSHSAASENLPAVAAEGFSAAYRRYQQALRRHALRPRLLVRYRRMSFQLPGLRLSLDSQIGFGAVDGLSHELPSRGAWSGATASREPFCVLEVKYTGAEPQILQQLQRRFAISRMDHYSKFLSGMRAVETRTLLRQES